MTGRDRLVLDDACRARPAPRFPGAGRVKVKGSGRRRVGWIFGWCAALLLSGCAGPFSILQPAGPGSHDIAKITWAMLIGGSLIWIGVVLLAVYACCRRQAGVAPARVLLIGGGLVFPTVVVLALLVYGIRSGHALLPLPIDEPVYRVDVQAHQWWWEVAYPHTPRGTLYSANEIHIPVGRPVDVHVTTQDVVHSFWVPRLGGKIDAIPGRTNVIRLQADRAGTYHGMCSEFCGAQHSRMQLMVFAHDEDALRQRLQALAVAGPSPQWTRSGVLDFQRHCLACHSVDASTKSTTPGPNLADITLRATLGAGTLPNSPENLREWLLRHQALKPGNLMPDQALTAAEAARMASYLEGRP